MPDANHNVVDSIVDLLKGRAPLPSRPQPPGMPKPSATETPGTPQYELTKAQDDARNNPAFQPKRDGTTFCDRATCEIVRQMKGPIGALTYPNGEYAVANDAARYLAEDALQPSGHWRAVDTPLAVVRNRTVYDGNWWLQTGAQPYGDLIQSGFLDGIADYLLSHEVKWMANSESVDRRILQTGSPQPGCSCVGCLEARAHRIATASAASRRREVGRTPRLLQWLLVSRRGLRRTHWVSPGLSVVPAHIRKAVCFGLSAQPRLLRREALELYSDQEWR
jgi:hypothetical protein